MRNKARMKKFLLLLFFLFSPLGGMMGGLHAQINTDHVMMMGRNALYYEDYVLSIQRFNMVINAKPFLAEPYFFRGLAKFYLEDYSGATTDCSSAIERNPYTENYYVLRGLCQVNLKHFSQAEEDYRRATSINPLNSGSWHNMVLCQMEQKAYERADSSLDVMIRQWPREADNYTLKAQISFARNDTLNAMDWIARALEADAYDGQAWSMRAMVTANRGEYAEAEECLDKAILQLPRNAGLYINRALARYHRQNLRGAMQDYDAALEMEPGNYLGHFNRGLLRAQVGDDNRAIEDFNFVLEQEPDNTIALYNRALLLDQTGDYRGAIRDISAVLKDYPEFWTGYQTRAQIRRKIGDVYGAERDEFRVLKAEMEKRTGTYKSQATKTRKQSDMDPSKYDRLVEADTQEPERDDYASEYRGRVQNKAVDLQLQPFYVFTYYNREGDLRSQVSYHRLLEELNAVDDLPAHLYLTGDEAVLSEQQITFHFQDITQISAIIDSLPEAIAPRLRRALDYYHVRDFSASISDLDCVLAVDTLCAAALYLRAQVRQAQLQVGHTRGAPATGVEENLPLTAEQQIAWRQVEEDYLQLLAIMPDMLYAQYNLAGVYVWMNDYDRAVETYTRVLEQDGRFSVAYYNRGIVRLLTGHRNEALSDLSQAGEYGLYSAYNLIKRYSRTEK